MEKLTLEQLAPYLPYGLKIQTNLGILNVIPSNLESALEYIAKGRKPILRPLSDLTKENCNNVNITMGGLSAYGIMKRIQQDPFQGNYHMMAFLFKNHFDVFGLIEKGLAIDINTL